MSSKQKLVRIFFKSMLVTFVVCGLLMGGVYWAYQTFIYDGGTSSNSGSSSGDTSGNQDNGDEDIPESNVNKSIAVFGTDVDGYRTDVIFVVNFNSETNKVKVVSVPRDTKVEWTSEQQDQLRDLKGYTRSVSKINEMTAYAGMDSIRDFTVAQLESLLGIKIDNYVVVSLDAFKKIIDAIGGVEMDVPIDMYYVDPYQDLYIDLDAGLQVLDGEKAEMLVRFRKGNTPGTGYPDGDLGRVRTQQLFLEAVAEKVMSPQIITKIPQLVTVLFTSVKTDVQLSEILPYYGYVMDFDLANLEFHTLPGEDLYQSGAWYFVPDMDEIQDFSSSVFYEHLLPDEEDQVEGEVTVDKTVRIEILNGSGVSGAAAKAEEALEAQGYSIEAIGNYTGEAVSGTQILAKDTTQAQQFRAYYPDAMIVQDAAIPYDIQIILGQ